MTKLAKIDTCNECYFVKGKIHMFCIKLNRYVPQPVLDNDGLWNECPLENYHDSQYPSTD